METIYHLHPISVMIWIIFTNFIFLRLCKPLTKSHPFFPSSSLGIGNFCGDL